jgi:hypothetical protein
MPKKNRMLVIFRSIIILAVAACSYTCQVAEQLPASSRLTTVSKVPLQFGPEFEFVLKPSVSYSYPSRNLIYAQAVRQFSPYLDLSSDKLFPRPWLPGMEDLDSTNLLRTVEYNRDAQFGSSAPRDWPQPSLVKLRTASINGPRFNLAKNPPTIEFVFPDKQRLKLTYGVDDVFVEAHVNPLSIGQSELYRPIIDDLFFNIADSSGILVPEYGGGHIHIDIRSIIERTNPENPKDGIKLIRNFVSDFYANNYFVSYILRADPQWAQTLGMTSSEDVDNFNKFMADIDEKLKIARIDKIEKAVEFVSKEFQELNRLIPANLIPAEIEERVMIGPEFSLRKPAIMFSPAHKTMEIRALSAQKNYSEYINVTKLLTGRLDFLAQDLRPHAPLVWDDIALVKREFNNQKISRQTLERIEHESARYLFESLSFLENEERTTLKAELINYFTRGFDGLSCGN